MDYIIVQEPSASRLIQGVRLLLGNGWVCQGGISLTALDDHLLYMQAMIKQPPAD